MEGWREGEFRRHEGRGSYEEMDTGWEGELMKQRMIDERRECDEGTLMEG